MKKTRVIKKCELCGKEMEVKLCRLSSTHYCSRDCANKGKKGKRCSQKTEFYKGMKGTRFKTGTTRFRGYIMVLKPDHPRARVGRYVSQHILVWEETHGKLLPMGWVVHHYNGIKDDNRPEISLECQERNTIRRLIPD